MVGFGTGFFLMADEVSGRIETFVRRVAARRAAGVPSTGSRCCGRIWHWHRVRCVATRCLASLGLLALGTLILENLERQLSIWIVMVTPRADRVRHRPCRVDEPVIIAQRGRA